MNESGSTVGMHAMAHIEAAQREGKTLSAYAREHGLSASHLYRVRRLMQDLSGAPRKRGSTPRRQLSHRIWGRRSSR